VLTRNQEQEEKAKEIQTRIPTITEELSAVSAAESECMAANVEENDYTVFTWQDLEFELELLIHSIAKKISFIDNQVPDSLVPLNEFLVSPLALQIVSRNMTNLTPAQLEQFESTFRYFDKDETNTLQILEMMAALASLGIVYSDQDMYAIYDQLVAEYGAVTFEAFINLLVSSIARRGRNLC
jgi:hypothetical protein